MAKAQHPTEEKKTLGQRVSEWLGNEGYGLEYRTWKAFRDAGLDALLSDYVEAPEGKPREIDVSVWSHLSPNVAVRVLCECKYSMDKPWVLMSSALPADFESDWRSTPKSKSIASLPIHVIKEYQSSLEACWHFSQKHQYAQALVQAFKGERDVAFESLQKIANAAWDIVGSARHGGNLARVVAFPCLVVEGPLLRAEFDFKEGRFVVRPVPFGRLAWAGCRAGTLVDVVHADSLKGYADAVRLTIQQLLEPMKKFQAMLAPRGGVVSTPKR